MQSRCLVPSSPQNEPCLSPWRCAQQSSAVLALTWAFAAQTPNIDPDSPLYFPALTKHQLQKIIPLRFHLLHQAIGVFSDWLSITLFLLHINQKSLSTCYDSCRFDLHPAPTHAHVVSFLTQVWYFSRHIGLIFLENPSQPGTSCRHFLAIQRPIEQLRPLLYSPRMPNRWFKVVRAHFFWKLQNPE